MEHQQKLTLENLYWLRWRLQARIQVLASEIADLDEDIKHLTDGSYENHA